MPARARQHAQVNPHAAANAGAAVNAGANAHANAGPEAGAGAVRRAQPAQIALAELLALPPTDLLDHLDALDPLEELALPDDVDPELADAGEEEGDELGDPEAPPNEQAEYLWEDTFDGLPDEVQTKLEPSASTPGGADVTLRQFPPLVRDENWHRFRIEPGSETRKPICRYLAPPRLERAAARHDDARQLLDLMRALARCLGQRLPNFLNSPSASNLCKDFAQLNPNANPAEQQSWAQCVFEGSGIDETRFSRVVGHILLLWPTATLPLASLFTDEGWKSALRTARATPHRN